MVYPTFVAGQRLTAQMLSDMQWKSVEQGSAQTVNNSAALVNTNIVIPLAAGAVYMYRLLIGYTSQGSGVGSPTPEDNSDVKFAWTDPPGGEVRRWTHGYGSLGSGPAGDDFTSVSYRRPVTTTPVRIGAAGEGFTNSYYEFGTIYGGDGGSTTFQFAQFVAGAFDLSITGSSRCDYLRIG